MSKRVLCFGDSNTWGFDPEKQVENSEYSVRLSYEVRWTGRMRKLLGEEYSVIEEALNGRTSVWDDPVAPFRNGLRYLEPCLHSHEPLDLVIIMIGTNDLKPRICGRAYDIAEGIECLANCVRAVPCGRFGKTPEILLVSPISIAKDIASTPFSDEFGGIAGYEQSLLLPKYIAQKAEALGCHFIDAAQYADAVIDGVHMDEANHAKLAAAIAEKVKTII